MFLSRSHVMYLPKPMSFHREDLACDKRIILPTLCCSYYSITYHIFGQYIGAVNMEPPTRPRRQPVIDYLLLNDGYEEDRPAQRISLASSSQSTIESSIELEPEDSISQFTS